MEVTTPMRLCPRRKLVSELLEVVVLVLQMLVRRTADVEQERERETTHMRRTIVQCGRIATADVVNVAASKPRVVHSVCVFYVACMEMRRYIASVRVTCECNRNGPCVCERE